MTNRFHFKDLGFIKSALVSAILAISSLGIASASPVNVNTATQSELESIKGIGPSKTRTIVVYHFFYGSHTNAADPLL